MFTAHHLLCLLSFSYCCYVRLPLLYHIKPIPITSRQFGAIRFLRDYSLNWHLFQLKQRSKLFIVQHLTLLLFQPLFKGIVYIYSLIELNGKSDSCTPTTTCKRRVFGSYADVQGNQFVLGTINLRWIVSPYQKSLQRDCMLLDVC